MKRYAIVVDLGGTNIKAAVVGHRSPVTGHRSREKKIKILKKISAPTKNYESKDALIEGLSKLSLGLIQSLNINKGEVDGIGIGLPGLIDSDKGIVHGITNIKGFKDVPLRKLIEEKTGIAVFLDNDVNVMTLGELYYGAGRGARNVVCVTLGTGVGGGLVIDGKLYRGGSLSAGEIGHMPLNEKGPKCNCGGLGCMEKFVGNKYIVEAALKKVKGGGKSVMVKLVNGDLRKITPEIISAAAKKGDGLAISVWKEIAGHLGVTLAGVVNLLNPERIIIGGGVAEAGKFLFGPLRETVRQRAMDVPARRVKIVKAMLGQDAGLIGAAVLVRLGRKYGG
ncbi:MAG: ROK family protein [Candidatus Omnitrophica bacterium]|nr:ROK family protein [Candidatus Omnitrophota bacterium]